VAARALDPRVPDQQQDAQVRADTDRFVVSGFGDEIDPDPDQQLSHLGQLGIHHLDLRRAWGRGVLDLDDADVEKLRDVLQRHAARISTIASPIGKTQIDEDGAFETGRLETAIRLAHAFDTPYIRLFSFYHERVPIDDCRDEVMRRLRGFVEQAERANVTLLLENEQRLWGDTPERCRDIMETIDSPRLRVTFDTGNYAMIGVPAYDVAYPLVRPYLVHVQIKDVRTAQRDHTVAGQGDGQIPQVLAALHRDGYRGYLSLEPHLIIAGRASGFSGPDLFTQAANALQGLLTEVSQGGA
jgi:sugar phosphate isomerase/epimerase